jgi:hypothetical protein
MAKFCYWLILTIIIPTYAYSQESFLGIDEGFSLNADGEKSYRIQNFDSSLETTDSLANSALRGSISSIFHEVIDSVWVKYKIEKSGYDSILALNGHFQILLNNLKKERLIELEFKHPEFHVFDTSFLIFPLKVQNITINLTPKFKISLRGRVYAGNLPVQGVKVKILLKNKIYQVDTKGCYYDAENYWNCLYDGMFKQDLILDSSTDSIKVLLDKEGMMPRTYGMVLSDYTGDIIDIKMKYASKLSSLPKNCMSLKLSFPFLTIENNWLVDLSYYRMLNGIYLNRFSMGIDANLLLTPVSVSHTTFRNNSATFDTSYFSGYVGPSLLFWIIKPDKRYFSTYVGLTSGMRLNDGNLFIQPFIGSRIFIDFNKAVSIELRNASYDLDVVHYTFNPFGNAYRTIESENFNDFMLDIGLQIAF